MASSFHGYSVSVTSAGPPTTSTREPVSRNELTQSEPGEGRGMLAQRVSGLGITSRRPPIAGSRKSISRVTCSFRDDTSATAVLRRGEKSGEELVISTGKVELAAQGDFGSVVLHQVQRHVAQDREIVRAIVVAAPGLILVHDDVENPV